MWRPGILGPCVESAGMAREYYVYIMANNSGTLYTGVTNSLLARTQEHKDGLHEVGFTARYHITKVVYFESTPDVSAAIAREKQIKGWNRQKKIDLVRTMNPKWLDLSLEWL